MHTHTHTLVLRRLSAWTTPASGLYRTRIIPLQQGHAATAGALPVRRPWYIHPGLLIPHGPQPCPHSNGHVHHSQHKARYTYPFYRWVGWSNVDTVTCLWSQQQGPAGNRIHSPRVGSPRPSPLHQAASLHTHIHTHVHTHICLHAHSRIMLQLCLTLAVQGLLLFVLAVLLCNCWCLDLFSWFSLSSYRFSGT